MGGVWGGLTPPTPFFGQTTPSRRFGGSFFLVPIDEEMSTFDSIFDNFYHFSTVTAVIITCKWFICIYLGLKQLKNNFFN